MTLNSLLRAWPALSAGVRGLPAVLCACACAGSLLAFAAPAAAASRCVDEDTYAGDRGSDGAQPPLPPPAPRQQLQAMVREALDRSQAVGAGKMLAEAALQDIGETRAGKAVQATVGGGVGPGGSTSLGVTETSAAQLRATLNVSQLLYDGGHTDRLIDWRTELAESARYGHLTMQEQVALTTVTLALERSRFRMQTQVYVQNVRKMACLVEALETIVRADRGRASELVQARKALQQAELSQSQSQSMVRQIEVRLRRFVGDGLPGVEGMTTVFAAVPDLDQLVADVEHSNEINQLHAAAVAARKYADAVAAGNKPQLSWNIGGNTALGLGGNQGRTRSSGYALGLLLNIPLLNPGTEPAAEAARLRARAAELQRGDELESRRFRVAEVHEQAVAGIDRARRLAAVLKDSEQLRNFTLQQWQQLGRRSLFDVMGAESEHYNLRVAYVNALHDVQELNANLLSLGRGVAEWLQ